MGGLQLKNVCRKHGRLYYRRKVAGQDTYQRLPDLDDPAFAEAYARANQTQEGRRRPGAGTTAALVADYRASSAYRQIPSPRTRANYAYYLDMLVEEHGHRSVKGWRPVHVRKMVDAMQETPGKANNWLTVLKTLMNYAAENDWRGDNPAAGIKRLKIGEHKPWPSEVIAEAMAAATPMLRFAIVTGLCSGARIGDAIRMQHGWHDGRIMEFMTGKKKKDVAIPMHPFWLEEMKRIPRRAITLLYDRSGKPFRREEAIQARIRVLMKKIGHPGYTFHGLRKNACCYLVELGLTDAEVGAILAMTPETVRHYSKRARTLMMARGVADRVIRGDVLPLKGGQLERSAK
ncbi:hypothetical protein [Sphingosinicella sp. LY1275]|uniref:tyrosine-type recombinase/integrase n=1 Tax=Sphingosinicella sp. LY1275 TaxID=3095379 RepID=UPI002ADEFBEA|nr:hypothetical protein [Sphingosinicella sp. LY1275]MEA1015574.1 hypothetical protein [Sphingosinicella sp. LY1275]